MMGLIFGGDDGIETVSELLNHKWTTRLFNQFSTDKYSVLIFPLLPIIVGVSLEVVTLTRPLYLLGRYHTLRASVPRLSARRPAQEANLVRLLLQKLQEYLQFPCCCKRCRLIFQSSFLRVILALTCPFTISTPINTWHPHDKKQKQMKKG